MDFTSLTVTVGQNAHLIHTLHVFKSVILLSEAQIDALHVAFSWFFPSNNRRAIPCELVDLPSYNSPFHKLLVPGESLFQPLTVNYQLFFELLAQLALYLVPVLIDLLRKSNQAVFLSLNYPTYITPNSKKFWTFPGRSYKIGL